MFEKGFFSGLVKRSNKGVKKGNTAKTTFYRNHYIKVHPESDDAWGTKINGELIVGKLDNIKKCINHWYDTKAIVPPEHFEVLPIRPTNRKIVDYKGFKIINDTGEDKDWYVIHKGKLLKGTKSGIERKIDLALQRARAKKDAKVKKSIEMALNTD